MGQFDKFTALSPVGLISVTQVSETKTMTCRFAHKRVALLFTAVQTAPTARVIEWPQKPSHSAEARVRPPVTKGKSPREVAHENK